MTHKPNTPTTCAEPGCDRPREWDKQRGRFRSLYCPRHAKTGRAPKSSVPGEPTRYSPADVLAAWDTHPFGADFTYRGKVVLGLQKLGDGVVYRAQLAGNDMSVLIGADETLRRVEKP